MSPTNLCRQYLCRQYIFTLVRRYVDTFGTHIAQLGPQQPQQREEPQYSDLHNPHVRARARVSAVFDRCKHYTIVVPFVAYIVNYQSMLTKPQRHAPCGDLSRQPMGLGDRCHT